MNADDIPEPDELRRVARFLRLVVSDTLTNRTLPGAFIVKPFYRGFMSAVSACEQVADRTEILRGDN